MFDLSFLHQSYLINAMYRQVAVHVGIEVAGHGDLDRVLGHDLFDEQPRPPPLFTLFFSPPPPPPPIVT